MKLETLVILKNLIVNVFLVLAKILAGIMFNATSLVADGIHSLSDLITDFVSLFGSYKVSQIKGKNKKIFEAKTSRVIGLIIMLLAVFMIVDAFNAKKGIPKAIVIFVSLFVIGIKTLIVRYVAIMGKKLNSPILKASAEESTADVITSVIALVMIVLSQLTKYFSIFNYADIVGSIIIGCLTLIVGFDIFHKNK